MYWPIRNKNTKYINRPCFLFDQNATGHHCIHVKQFLIPPNYAEISEMCCAHQITYLRYITITESAGGLIVPMGIVCPVVSALTLTWFIRYTYY